jgi:transcriptional regulator with XRE-family HTH domain
MRVKRARQLLAKSRGPSLRQPRRGRQIDTLVGRRLREARLLAGASPQQLAAVLGVAAPELRKYETGARRLPAARLAVAVRFLGVPMSFLFMEQPGAFASLKGTGLTAAEIELVQCFRAIADERLRRRVLRFAKAASATPGTAE